MSGAEKMSLDRGPERMVRGGVESVRGEVLEGSHERGPQKLS